MQKPWLFIVYSYCLSLHSLHYYC